MYTCIKFGACSRPDTLTPGHPALPETQHKDCGNLPLPAPCRRTLPPDMGCAPLWPDLTSH